jgi:hypothetical protein
MNTLSYQFGYCMGVITHRAITTLRSLDPMRPKPDEHAEPDLLELCRTPALVRTGVDLNKWYENNVSICLPKPQRRRKKATPKRSTLDALI